MVAIAALTIGIFPVLARSTNPTISGCVNSTTGVLRIAPKCTNKEKTLRRNSVGPQGLPGPKGDQGASGPAWSAIPTKQYKYEISERNLPMTLATNSAGYQRDVLLAVDTSKLPSGTFLDGDDWYDQDYFPDFVLHLTGAEDLDANYGVIDLVCRHNVSLTGVYGSVVAYRFDSSASLPLAGTV